MMNLHPALAAIFVGRREQVRVSDLERAAKRKIDHVEQLAYQEAGVFKTTFAVIYDYDATRAAPTEIHHEPAQVERINPHPRRTRPQVGRAAVLARYAAAGIDPTKYEHLDNGRLAMVISNILRKRRT